MSYGGRARGGLAFPNKLGGVHTDAPRSIQTTLRYEINNSEHASRVSYEYANVRKSKTSQLNVEATGCLLRCIPLTTTVVSYCHYYCLYCSSKLLTCAVQQLLLLYYCRPLLLTVVAVVCLVRFLFSSVFLQQSLGTLVRPHWSWYT